MISFHSNEGGKSDRIMAVDCHPEIEEGLVTFVTVGGGGEGDVRVWSVCMLDEEPSVEEEENAPAKSAIPSFCGSLKKGHPGASVNCARFARDGARLASAGDRGQVCVWQGQKPAQFWRDCESHTVERSSLPHADDVYDLAWSKEGDLLAAGAIDGSASIWHVPSRKLLRTVRDHLHYIQGVAFNGDLLATASTDRTVRVYPVLRSGKGKVPKIDLGTPTVLRTYQKSDEEEQPMDTSTDVVDQEAVGGTKTIKSKPLFAGELQHSGFFRRLAFVADPLTKGSLIVPAALAKDAENDGSRFGALAFPLADLSKGPYAFLPAPDGPATAVRALGTRVGGGSFFAVCFQHAVCVYKSEKGKATPVVLAGGLHRAAINDVAWARDASLLIIASSDGYLSLVKFRPGELGPLDEPLPAIPDPPIDLTKKQTKQQPAEQQDDRPTITIDVDAEEEKQRTAVVLSSSAPEEIIKNNQENEAPPPTIIKEEEPQPVVPNKKRRIAPTLLSTTTS